MSWLNDTLEAPSAGSRKMMPEGTANHEVTGYRNEVNKYNGRNGLIVNFRAGQADFPLEPWASDQKSVDQFKKMFTSMAAGVLNIPTEGRSAQDVMGDVVKSIDTQAAIGNIVELNVVYTPQKDKGDGKHLKEDGTPWMNDKVYVNRFVSAGNHGAQSPGQSGSDTFGGDPAPAGFAGDDDIPFV